MSSSFLVSCHRRLCAALTGQPLCQGVLLQLGLLNGSCSGLDSYRGAETVGPGGEAPWDPTSPGDVLSMLALPAPSSVIDMGLYGECSR